MRNIHTAIWSINFSLSNNNILRGYISVRAIDWNIPYITGRNNNCDKWKLGRANFFYFIQLPYFVS